MLTPTIAAASSSEYLYNYIFPFWSGFGITMPLYSFRQTMTFSIISRTVRSLVRIILLLAGSSLFAKFFLYLFSSEATPPTFGFMSLFFWKSYSLLNWDLTFLTAGLVIYGVSLPVVKLVMEPLRSSCLFSIDEVCSVLTSRGSKLRSNSSILFSKPNYKVNGQLHAQSILKYR